MSLTSGLPGFCKTLQEKRPLTFSGNVWPVSILDYCLSAFIPAWTSVMVWRGVQGPCPAPVYAHTLKDTFDRGSERLTSSSVSKPVSTITCRWISDKQQLSPAEKTAMMVTSIRYVFHAGTCVGCWFLVTSIRSADGPALTSIIPPFFRSCLKKLLNFSRICYLITSTNVSNPAFTVSTGLRQNFLRLSVTSLWRLH